MGKKRTHYKKQEIPFFVAKLMNILDDPNNHQLISWNQTGDHFVIHNEDKLRHKILPQKFRHHNMASFIRQLNLYGFHKLENISQYYHEHFLRDQPEKARLIKRISNDKKKKKINKLYQKQMEEGYEKIYEQLQLQAQKNTKLKEQINELIQIKKQTKKSLKKLQFYSQEIKQKLENQSKYIPSSSQVESQKRQQSQRNQLSKYQRNNKSRDLGTNFKKSKQNTSSYEKESIKGQQANQQINNEQTPSINILRVKHKTVQEQMQELMNSYFL